MGMTWHLEAGGVKAAFRLLDRALTSLGMIFCLS